MAKYFVDIGPYYYTLKASNGKVIMSSPRHVSRQCMITVAKKLATDLGATLIIDGVKHESRENASAVG